MKKKKNDFQNVSNMAHSKQRIKQKEYVNMNEDELKTTLRRLEKKKEMTAKDEEFLSKNGHHELAVLKTRMKYGIEKINPDFKYEEADEYWDLQRSRINNRIAEIERGLETEKEAYEDFLSFLNDEITKVKALLGDEE